MLFFFAYLAYYSYYEHILHISYVLIRAYSCIFGTAHCCMFRAYFCIFKSASYGIFTLMHIQTYNTYICMLNAYLCTLLILQIHCIFFICIFVYISCIFGTACFGHISAYFNLPLCIFKLISVYLHLLCLPNQISLTKYSNCCWRAKLAFWQFRMALVVWPGILPEEL